MMRTCLIFLLVCLLGISSAQFRPSRDHDNCQVIITELNLKMYWTVTGNTMAVSLVSDAFPTSNSVGFFALALDRDHHAAATIDFHQSKKIDLWVGGRSSSQYCVNGCILDGYITGDSPRIDNNDNFVGLNISSSGTDFMVEFERDITTTDSTNDFPILLTGVTDVYYGYHKSKGLSGSSRTNVNVPEHCGTCIGSAGVNFGGSGISCDPPTGNTYTSPSGEFVITWTDDAANSQMHFEMSTTTAGYVSMGIAATTDLLKADIITGSVSGGQLTVLDEYGHDKSTQPKADGTNDVLNAAYTSVGGVTTVTFDRKYTTGDAQDVDITTADMYLLWGVSPSVITGSSYPKHSSAGLVAINFYNGGAGGAASGDSTGGSAASSGSASGSSYCAAAFCVDWKLINNNQEIEFTMSAKRAGYVSLGVGDSAVTNDGDFYTGWVDGAGTVFFMDGHAHDSTVADAEQTFAKVDKKLSQEVGGTTTIVWKRPLLRAGSNLTNPNTAETIDIVDKTMYLYWAYSDADGSGLSISSHLSSDRGVVQVNYITGQVTAIVEWTPDQVIVLIVSICLGIWVCIRYAHKLRKYLNADSDIAEAQRVAKLQAKYAEKNTPGTKTHLRGSVAEATFAKTQNNVNHNNGGAVEMKEIKTQSMNSIVPTVVPKNTGTKATFFLDFRVPYTGVSVRDVMYSSFYIIINILCLWVGEKELADKMGYLAIVNIFFVVLPATRNSLVVSLLGVSMDHMIHVHRWIARWAILCVTFHMVFFWFEWAEEGESLVQMFEEEKYLNGFFGWLCSMGLFITSLERFRRQLFDFFFYSHIIFFAGLFYFSILHTETFQPYFWATVIMYGGDRLMRFLWGIIPTKVLKFEVMKGGLMKITFSKSWLAKTLNMYDVGQYCFISFPFKGFFQWHPFSVASGPREETITIGIKSLGDHTKALLEHGNLLKKEGAPLWLRCDGPYGNIRCQYRRYHNLMLFGGGVGVTPIVGMMKDMFNVNINPRFPTPPHCVEVVHVIWSIPSADVYEWFKSEIMSAMKSAGKNGLPQLVLHLHVTRAKTRDGLDPILNTGRPDVRGLFDTVSSSSKQGSIRKSTLVFACGPQKMVDDCWDNCSRELRAGYRFDMHHEVFDF